MKQTTIPRIFMVAAVLMVLLAGCNKTTVNPFNASTAGSANIILKINSAGSGQAAVRATADNLTDLETLAALNAESFPVPGGDLNIQSALVNIAGIQLGFETESETGSDSDSTDAQSGYDGEQDGENDDNDAGDQADSVSVIGPYGVDISGGPIELATITVPAGTYNEISLMLATSDSAAFSGASMLIEGVYTSDSLGALNVSLSSNYADELAAVLTDSVIVVEASSEIPITVTFDLATWFSALDLSTATITGNEILINTTSNVSLLQAFNDQLENNAQIGEDHDGGNNGSGDDENDDGGNDGDDDGGGDQNEDDG